MAAVSEQKQARRALRARLRAGEFSDHLACSYGVHDMVLLDPQSLHPDGNVEKCIRCGAVYAPRVTPPRP